MSLRQGNWNRRRSREDYLAYTPAKEFAYFTDGCAQSTGYHEIVLDGLRFMKLRQQGGK